MVGVYPLSALKTLATHYDTKHASSLQVQVKRTNQFWCRGGGETFSRRTNYRGRRWSLVMPQSKPMTATVSTRRSGCTRKGAYGPGDVGGARGHSEVYVDIMRRSLLLYLPWPERLTLPTREGCTRDNHVTPTCLGCLSIHARLSLDLGYPGIVPFTRTTPAAKKRHVNRGRTKPYRWCHGVGTAPATLLLLKATQLRRQDIGIVAEIGFHELWSRCQVSMRSP